MRPKSLRHILQFHEVAVRQRFLLCPRPALNLTLSSNSVAYIVKLLGEYQSNGPARKCVAGVNPSVMFGNSNGQIAPSRARIIRPIATTQNVKPACHGLILRDALASLALLRMRLTSRETSRYFFLVFSRRRCSSSRGMISTKLQGLWRRSNWWTRISSHASRQAPGEPGTQKI